MAYSSFARCSFDQTNMNREMQPAVTRHKHNRLAAYQSNAALLVPLMAASPLKAFELLLDILS